ncbi:MAG: hypothetical protein QM530_08670 [Phycisphaerales bacterium]|nr:hypothetical protein [Phycisphaerales bacterium]
MLLIILLIPFCLSNAKRAQLKNFNPTTWAVYTAIAFLVGIMLFGFLCATILILKYPELKNLAQKYDTVRMSAFLQDKLQLNGTLYGLLILSGAFGGFLLIRYLIDKKQIVK